MSFVEMVQRLFRRDKVLIYTAIGDDDCIKALGNLSNARIRYESKARGIYAGRQKRSLRFDTKLSQYDIYVRKEDEYQARQALEE